MNIQWRHKKQLIKYELIKLMYNLIESLLSQKPKPGDQCYIITFISRDIKNK